MSTQTLWYLSRGTGIITLILLTTTLILGIAGATANGWLMMPRFVVAGLHRSVSLLVVAFVSVHVATSVIDPYAGIRVVDAVVPFVSSYRPFWIGLGALTLDLTLAVIVTSLLRARIGLRGWRLVHWSVYLVWPVAVVHALGSGSDVRSGLLLVVVSLCAAFAITAGAWRLVTAETSKRRRGALFAAGLATVVRGHCLDALRAASARMGADGSDGAQSTGRWVMAVATHTSRSAVGVAGPPTSVPRLLAGVRAHHGRMDLSTHLHWYGDPFVPGLDVQGRLTEVVARSGLTGRGGAGFPTSRKLESVAHQRGRTVVVINAMEGEPASAKDRYLLAELRISSSTEPNRGRRGWCQCRRSRCAARLPRCNPLT